MWKRQDAAFTTRAPKSDVLGYAFPIYFTSKRPEMSGIIFAPPERR
jgi:hypothetical protein